MTNIWDFFGWFQFIGKLMDLNVGAGMSLYFFYSASLFLSFWLLLAFALIKKRREILPSLLSKPSLYLTLGLTLFFFFSSNDLYSTYTYEVQNLSDALAAVRTNDLSLLLRQTRVVPLFFGAVLYFSNLQVLNLVLSFFLALFYAVWERTLGAVLGARTALSVPLALLAAPLNKEMYYFFSAYSIFALLFSALFVYSWLAVLRDSEKDQPFTRLALPVYLLLLASLFRQESVVLFAVYLTGMLFLGRTSARKAAVCLLAGAFLYLPFLYTDWTHEENQRLSPHWDQQLVELTYDSSTAWLPPGVHMRNSLLCNVATNIKQGRRFEGMSKPAFIEEVRTAYFTPQPSVTNIWYNLKYRSSLFLVATALWCAFFLAALLNFRRLGSDRKFLAVLAAYIWSIFLIYHLANLAILIGLSYNYLLPAYFAFSMLVVRSFRNRAENAA